MTHAGGFTLRPYQREFGDAIAQAYDAGVWSQAGILPTGGGKTVVFAHVGEFIAHVLARHDWINRRGLVIAHRDELIEQAAAKIQHANPDLCVEVEQAGERVSPMADVVVASVQTLAALNGARLDALSPDRIRYVIVDEGHHAPADTYQAVLGRLGLVPPRDLLPGRHASPESVHAARVAVRDWRRANHPGRLLLGVTATPSRADAIGLEWTFEQVVYEKSLRWMIQQGYLVGPRGFVVDTGLSLDTVKIVGGDFQTKGLASLVNTPDRNAAIVDAWVAQAKGRPTVTFAVDRQHARDLAAMFLQRAGVVMAYVDGEMSGEERQVQYAACRTRAVAGLVNCNLLTEGWDEPCISCVIMARPTRSQSLYMQMVGRGLRLDAGKTDCVVLDAVDNSARHSLATLGDLFGLPARFNLKGDSAADAADRFEAAQAQYPALDLSTVASVGDIDKRIRAADLWRVSIPAEVTEHASLRWIKDGPGRYHLPIPSRGESGALGPSTSRVTIVEGTLGDWRVTLRAADGTATPIAMGDDLPDAFRRGERWLGVMHPDVVRMRSSDAAWRRRPPTGKQLARLVEWGIPFGPNVSKGEASDLIDQYIARKRAK